MKLDTWTNTKIPIPRNPKRKRQGWKLMETQNLGHLLKGAEMETHCNTQLTHFYFMNLCMYVFIIILRKGKKYI